MISGNIRHLSTKRMISQHNLGKLLTQDPTSLIGVGGGVVSHAYFKSQHVALYHDKQGSRRGVHCSCPQRNMRDNEIDKLSQETKSKLETLKNKLAKNVFFEKYKDKFQQMEQTSPRELLAKLEQLDARVTEQNKAKAREMARPKGKEQYLLKDVMDVDRIKDLEKNDIVFLWQEFHRKKEGLLAAVMSGSVFDKMADLATLYPMFLMPLPRPTGYEFLFVQYMGKAFHFTPLISYQAHKENAPECLRLICYTDLQTSQDLVLMRGEFDKNLMSPKDAHIMAIQVNFYYGETSEPRRKLVETFTTNPHGFDHMNLIQELTKLQESKPHLFEFEE